MFIGNLSETEKKSFATLAWHLVNIDGVLTDSEESVLDSIEIETGHRGGDLTEDYMPLANHFDSRKSRISVLLELLSLAHVDGHYDLTEVTMINRLADAFSVDETELEMLLAWVVRQTLLLQEAESFMES